MGLNGVVYSVKTGKPIKPRINNHSLVVTLTNAKEGKRKTMTVGRLVAKLYLEEFDENKIVVHKDGDIYNNRPDNLMCCTNKEAAKHRDKIGLRWGPAMRHPPVMCVETGLIFWTYTEAAKMLDTYPSGVYKCAQGIQSHTKHLHFRYV